MSEASCLICKLASWPRWRHPNYHPVKPKALARKLEVPAGEYDAFKIALKELQRLGRVEIGKGNAVKPVGPHGTLTGIFRKAAAGFGFCAPQSR